MPQRNDLPDEFGGARPVCARNDPPNLLDGGSAAPEKLASPTHDRLSEMALHDPGIVTCLMPRRRGQYMARFSDSPRRATDARASLPSRRRYSIRLHCSAQLQRLPAAVPRCKGAGRQRPMAGRESPPPNALCRWRPHPSRWPHQLGPTPGGPWFTLTTSESGRSTGRSDAAPDLGASSLRLSSEHHPIQGPVHSISPLSPTEDFAQATLSG